MFTGMMGKYCCGLDIGSQTIKAALVGPAGQQGLDLKGVYELRSAGFRNGSITDLGELSECIHAAIEGLSKSTGAKIKEITVGINGDMVAQRTSDAVIPLMDRGNKVISAQDIKKVQAQARLLGAEMDEIILHDFPQYYRVDNVNNALNPVGLYGRKLEVHSLLVVVNSTFIRNLTKAVNQAGFDVQEFAFSPLACADVALNDNQRKQGCVLVGIGSASTDLAIFKDGQLRFFDNVSVGGSLISRVIAEKLNLPVDLAEEIKESYASALSAGAQLEEEILVKRDEGYAPIRKSLINESVESVVGNLVESVLGSLERSALQEQINLGLILVGGGAQLTGLIERIEAATNLPVRLAKVQPGVDKLRHAVKFAAAIGLAAASLKGSSSAPAKSNGHARWPAAAVERIKFLYQEYF